jgi:D-glycero-alpha-D-manno-heptose 1-phosphate guanylyltransferase
MIAIILAGGFGTRLRSVVPDLPKPMAPINSSPFIAHLMDYWLAQGIEKFCISVGYMHKKIIDYFGDNYKGASVYYSIEESPLGTGGGLLLAISKIKNESLDFDKYYVVLNGDTFFSIQFKDFLNYAELVRADVCMALSENNDISRYMTVKIDGKGKIINLNDATKKKGTINGGVYLFSQEIFNSLGLDMPIKKLSLEDELIPSLKLANSRIYGYNSAEVFIDIGVPDDYKRAKEILNY